MLNSFLRGVSPKIVMFSNLKAVFLENGLKQRLETFLSIELVKDSANRQLLGRFAKNKELFILECLDELRKMGLPNYEAEKILLRSIDITNAVPILDTNRGILTFVDGVTRKLLPIPESRYSKSKKISKATISKLAVRLEIINDPTLPEGFQSDDSPFVFNCTGHELFLV